MKIEVTYHITPRRPQGTHKDIEEVSPTKLFCPYCGKQDVWQEDRLGDFDVGPQIYCRTCLRTGHVIQWDHQHDIGGTSVTSQIFRAILGK